MGGPNLDGELLSDAGKTPLPADPAELAKLTSEQGVNYISAQSLNEAGFRVDPANPNEATNPRGWTAYKDKYGWHVGYGIYGPTLGEVLGYSGDASEAAAASAWLDTVGGSPIPTDTWTGIDAGALNIKPHAIPLPPLPLPEPHLFAPMAVPGYTQDGHPVVVAGQLE